MNCPSCNTPVSRHSKSCPACGKSLTASLGSGSQPSARPSHGPLSPSRALEDPELDLQDEVSLDEPMEDPGATGSAGATGMRGPGQTGEYRAAKPRPAPRTAPAAAPVGAPSPAEVRALAVEHPERVESGLKVERDAAGHPVGAGLATDVGEIHLLARDSAGSLVVVMVPGRDADKDVVGDVLRRIGWVRKHRAEVGQGVRGLVLLARVPDDVAYAASAVSDTVSFKTYRMQIAFEEVSL